jgi:hypothetical protein
MKGCNFINGYIMFVAAKEQRMSVFVIQKPRPGGVKKITYDLSPALDFGTFVYIFESSDQPGLTPVPAMHKALKALQDFGENDYLLWAGGDPCAFAIGVMAAANANNGVIQFLRWEREGTPDQRVQQLLKTMQEKATTLEQKTQLDDLAKELQSTIGRSGRGFYLPVKLSLKGPTK